jgi:hypothetical protein
LPLRTPTASARKKPVRVKKQANREVLNKVQASQRRSPISPANAAPSMAMLAPESGTLPKEVVSESQTIRV